MQQVMKVKNQKQSLEISNFEMFFSLILHEMKHLYDYFVLLFSLIIISFLRFSINYPYKFHQVKLLLLLVHLVVEVKNKILYFH